MKVRRYCKRQRKPAACGQALFRVSLSFAAGAAAAVFAFIKYDFNCTWLSDCLNNGSVPAVFASCVLLDLAALLASTSILGDVLVPFTSFAAGVAVALQSASIISAGFGVISRKMLFSVLIPSAITLPPFFIVACHGILFSRLVESCQDIRVRRNAAARLAVYGAFSCIMAFAAAEYICRLLPVII
jgi:hypothetical protein